MYLRNMPVDSHVTFPFEVIIILVEIWLSDDKASALLYKITSFKIIKKLKYHIIALRLY